MDETLFLTINLIDRFLDRCTVIRKKLQLVGMTAMLLACKYEEVSVPLVDDFVLISDKAYTRKDVLDMVIAYTSSQCLYPICFRFLFPQINRVCVSIGEINGEHFTIQHVCANSICFHEEVSQGSTIRQKGKYKKAFHISLSFNPYKLY